MKVKVEISEWELLAGSEDFERYKSALDLMDGRKYLHRGQPDRYPCRVYREFFDDDRNWGYRHHFVYQQEVVCLSCGHKSLVWPDVGDLG